MEFWCVPAYFNPHLPKWINQTKGHITQCVENYHHQLCVAGKSRSIAPTPSSWKTACLHSSSEGRLEFCKVDPTICSSDVQADVSSQWLRRQVIDASSSHLRAWWVQTSSGARCTNNDPYVSIPLTLRSAPNNMQRYAPARALNSEHTGKKHTGIFARLRAVNTTVA